MERCMNVVRLGTMLVLGSALIATPTAAQLTSTSQRWALTLPQDSGTVLPGRFVQSSGARVIFQDSRLPRPHTFSLPWAASEPRDKSPFLAWFLSWLVPGGGQGY